MVDKIVEEEIQGVAFLFDVFEKVFVIDGEIEQSLFYDAFAG